MKAIARAQLILVGILLVTTSAITQPPPPPQAKNKVTKYKVKLRYDIPAPREPHVAQYDAMMKHLERVGFEFDPPRHKIPDSDREDRGKNYITGYIAADKKLKLLEPAPVQSIELIPFAPDEFKLPDAQVAVRLELSGNLTPDRQRELSNQIRVLLSELGFKESPGYDHRGYRGRPYTRLVGTIPRAKFDLLNRDLRNHPAGWLGPIIPREEIPMPLRDVNPVRVVEVLPDTEAVVGQADPEPRVPEYLEKISTDLWALVKDKDVESKPVRVQVGFVGALDADDRIAKGVLEELAPGFFVEGQLGQFVTGMIPLNQVKGLAVSPMVSVIRLPRGPRVDVEPTVKIKGDNDKALTQSGLKELHARGYKGKGVRIGIIDADFRGWKTLLKKDKLPAKTRIVDLTTEQDSEVYPIPFPDEGDQFGHGTLCAQAAGLAAPEAELVLIRIDTLDPMQLQEVLRYVKGGALSTTIELRHGELMTRAVKLETRREELLVERRLILNNFADDSDLKAQLEFLGPFYTWLYGDREWHRLRMQRHAELEEEQRQREIRFRNHLKVIATLRGIPILVNAVSWQHGYPLGSISPLSKLLDDPLKGPLWFQSVGNTRGQSWLGPFRNIAGDPAMKFADDDVELPKERWSSEVNFLAWQPYHGESKAELPEKARLRLTLQWREPHDPEYYLRADEEDFYSRPLATLGLQLLRQRDPQTKVLPADAFELVGRTSGWAERLEHVPGGSVYEHVLEVPLAKAGVYAIRVERKPSTQWVMGVHPQRKTPMYVLLEGLTPTGIRPLGVPGLPALEKKWDLRPRIFVEVIDDANRVQGRAVFADFATAAGAIGLPADARNVISVGAASLTHKPQPYSAFGSPAGMELARRPWLYAYDELELAGGGAFGATIANAFAAGTTAAMLSGNVTRADVVRMLRAQEGQVLRVPLGKR